MVSGTPKASLKVSQTAAQLRREILSGDLAQGTPLRQAALARRLGVSTIPIREAIRWLEQEGLVACSPHRGAEVGRTLPEEILEFARIRIALETEALAMALPFHTPATLAAAREHLEASRRAVDSEGHYQAYTQFLRSLYQPGGHPLMLAEILRLVAQSQRYAGIFAAIVAQLSPSVPRPHHVLDALAAGDLALAQARLRQLYEHSAILGAGLLYQRQLEEVPAVRRRRGRPRKLGR